MLELILAIVCSLAAGFAIGVWAIFRITDTFGKHDERL